MDKWEKLFFFLWTTCIISYGLGNVLAVNIVCPSFKMTDEHLYNRPLPSFSLGYVLIPHWAIIARWLIQMMKWHIQGVQEKLCFFKIHCHPSLSVRDLQSSQRNASVQSLLLAGIFLYNQYQPSAGEGEVANFREFLEKNTIFNEHPVIKWVRQKYMTSVNK